MSKFGYRVRLAFGWLCYVAFVHLPYGYRLPGWVLAWAGFFAHDHGYDAHIARKADHFADPGKKGER